MPASVVFTTIVLLSVLLKSCASKHPIPNDSNKRNSFQYCGGEVWGYTADLLGKPKGEGIWNKKSDPERPFLALFLHMDPKGILDLWYVIRAKVGIQAKIDSNMVVEVDGKPEKYKIELLAFLNALDIYQIYPYSKYDAKPHDLRKNEWRVGKKNPWLFNVVVDGYQVVKAPETVLNSNIDEGNINIELDHKKYDNVVLQSTRNIWPYKTGLKNSSIVVTTPKMVLNGKTIPEKKFKFNMDYEMVKKQRSKFGRCPSLAEILRWNT